eukprot:GHUV01005418.1.p3 GENE.GHUV01005418.1~~GHUV01005418.1.p3  ORF type:complete len:111 (+),score=7.82 GHUV01005418.1:2576-2908(+)
MRLACHKLFRLPGHMDVFVGQSCDLMVPAVLRCSWLVISSAGKQNPYRHSPPRILHVAGLASRQLTLAHSHKQDTSALTPVRNAANACCRVLFCLFAAADPPSLHPSRSL